MQYYRLWIYACNAVLLSSVVAFVATVLTLVTDYRAELTRALGLFQPCVIYGFLLLAIQGCGLTIYGCFAARRLDARLLKIYWYLLLCFLGSDIVTGATWMIKFEGQMSNFPDKIRGHFYLNYGNESEFTSLWDKAQKELRCCGVESPSDFKFSSWWMKTDFGYPHRVVPESCCVHDLETHYLTERAVDSSNEIENPITVYYQSSEQSRKMKQRKLAKSQNKNKNRKANKLRELQHDSKSKSELEDRYLDIEYPVTQAFRRSYKKNRIPRTDAPPTPENQEQKVYEVSHRHECRRTSYTGRDIHQKGCGALLAAWLQQSAALLFVLNYCVLAFVKVCFLAILRHELKEMIQKIELLKTQDTAPLFPELAAALGLNKLSPQPTRKTIGQMTDMADVRDSRSHHIPNGTVEMEPLLYSNHIQNSNDSVLNKKDDGKSDKELSAGDGSVSSPIQNANSVLGNAIGGKEGRPFNNNDYFEMKELSGKSRQTDI